MLRSPEAQQDPHYWVSVFAGHCLVGLILWVLLGSVALVALVYALGWEAIQLALFDADPWDCLLDWAAVVLGALGAMALWHNDAQLLRATVAAGLIIAASGALVRMPSRGKPQSDKKGSR